MKRRMMKWARVFFIGCALMTAMSCNDDSEPSGKGEVDIEITDAPCDDPNVKAMIVTIAEVRVNGEAVSGFTKQTINLMAYQEGSTKLLTSTSLDAKSYNNVTLVLDVAQDAMGNAPGCYVLTEDGTRHALSSANTLNVKIDDTWKVASNTRNRMVIDFDLRKAVTYSSSQAGGFSFVNDANLSHAVTIFAKESTGSVKGTYEQQGSVDADKIIVYAYKKGTFNAATETQAQTQDQIYFRNAVASAEVKSTLNGNVFILPFLAAGEYELHFAGYKMNESGRYSFSSRLQSETSVNGQIGSLVKVQSGVSLNIKTSITGMM